MVGEVGVDGLALLGAQQQDVHLVGEAFQQFVVPLQALLHEVARFVGREVGDHLHVGDVSHGAPACTGWWFGSAAPMYHTAGPGRVGGAGVAQVVEEKRQKQDCQN